MGSLLVPLALFCGGFIGGSAAYYEEKRHHERHQLLQLIVKLEEERVKQFDGLTKELKEMGKQLDGQKTMIKKILSEHGNGGEE